MTRPLVTSSINLIKRNQAASGAYIASPGYDTYAYCWLRDGAFIASAMDAHGHHRSAEAFHRWAATTVVDHAHKVEDLEANLEHALKGTGDPLRPLDDRYVLHTRFTIDGKEGHESWGNFQLDGYGFWLTSIAQHIVATDSDPTPYSAAIDLVCSYLEITWRRPCYDSWEEYPSRRHMATWAAIANGLHEAGELADNAGTLSTAETIAETLIARAGPNGTLLKFVPGSTQGRPTDRPQTFNKSDQAVAGHERLGRPLPRDTIDGSALLVLDSFGPFSPRNPIVTNTLAAIEDSLVVDGGVHRYLEDEYYGGGLWIVLAGALAQAHAAYNPTRTNQILAWIEHQADAAGRLSEQVSSCLRHPATLDPWTRRWGPPAKPLLWSHATYLLGVAAADKAQGDEITGMETTTSNQI